MHRYQDFFDTKEIFLFVRNVRNIAQRSTGQNVLEPLGIAPAREKAGFLVRLVCRKIRKKPCMDNFAKLLKEAVAKGEPLKAAKEAVESFLWT